MTTDVNFGAISEALNDKTDRDMQNVDTVSGADGVIEFQRPTAENNYTWYRLYKSGWCEQGGYASSISADSSLTVNLLKSYTNTNYNCLATVGIWWKTCGFTA